jgi:hypothetical protein
MKLQHNFITKAHSLTNLFEGVTLMSQFKKRLEADAQKDPLRYDPYKYLGDGFEFFIEMFLALHPVDNRTGVYDYNPTQENDNGVDGTGKNIRGEKCVVQVKYRSNTQSFLTATKDHLSNMFSDGMLTHGVIADTQDPKNYRHFVFTTTTGLHFYTDQEMFKSKVRCFGFQEFRQMLDNNTAFWTKALEIVRGLRKEPQKPALKPAKKRKS